jgi:aryl carrier-like protein
LLPSDTAGDLWKDRKTFLDRVWPVIDDINGRSPTHSRILPEMVGILPPGTEIPVATKMTILRPACYKKFAAEIDALYSGFENGTGQAKRVLGDQEEMQIFLRDTITNVLGNKGEDLESNTDLFAYGVDSLQATRIRNVIQKSIELNGRTLGQNVVYEHPSIKALSTYLLELMSGMDQDKSTAKQHQVMLDMVDKWSSRLVEDRSVYKSVDVASSAGGEVVLLTGATGSLGAHILDCLIRSPSVHKVICLSRAKSHDDSLYRVQTSLRERMRPATCLDKLVSFAADVNKADLGLSSAEYEMLRTEVTTIIHNAWPVNFVLSTESFDEHVGGAVNLLNLALKSPKDKTPAFYFSSSVGTRQGRYEESVSEDFPDSPETAGPMGYARSKWVVEKVLERAGKTTEATVAVLRIGQLVGDTEK